MGLMNDLGYDAARLGNHEFDLLPTGAASAVSYRGRHSCRWQPIWRSWTTSTHGVRRSRRSSIRGTSFRGTPRSCRTVSRLGYFGIMGESAWEDVNKPYGEEAYPLGMGDRFTAAEEAVSDLRNTEGVDIVICLSHSGVNEPEYWTGEDVDLAGSRSRNRRDHQRTHPHPDPDACNRRDHHHRSGQVATRRGWACSSWSTTLSGSGRSRLRFGRDRRHDSRGCGRPRPWLTHTLPQLDSTVLAPDYTFSDAIAETRF